MKPRRPIPHVGTVASLLLLSVPASGCGFILAHGPPEGHGRMDDFSCTESNVGPIIDIIAFGGLALTFATWEPPYGDRDPARAIAASGAAAVVGGSSAAVGFIKSKRCRAAKRQLAERRAQWRVVVVIPSVDTLAVGERVQLTAAVHGPSGLPIRTAEFTWSSSSDAIASVTNAGLVTAHVIGSVVITARTDSVIGAAHLIVVGRK